MLNQRDSAFLVTGMILASLLDNFTTVFLVILWLFVHNEPLPQFMGGVRPQEIMGFFFRLIIRTRKTSPPPAEPKKKDEEEWTQSVQLQLQPSITTMPGNMMMTGGAPMLVYGGIPMQPMMGFGHMMAGRSQMVLPLNPGLVGRDDGER